MDYYDQLDACWDTLSLGEDTGPSFNVSGCGIFSFCNALLALTGTRPDALEVAQWAIDVGAYRPEGPGLYRFVFYERVEEAFGERLGFTIIKQAWGTAADDQLKAHLLGGGVAIAHVPAHFLALIGYDPERDCFHVVESRVSLRRMLPRDSWASAEKLGRGNACVDWYVLLSAR